MDGKGDTMNRQWRSKYPLWLASLVLLLLLLAGCTAANTEQTASGAGNATAIAQGSGASQADTGAVSGAEAASVDVASTDEASADGERADGASDSGAGAADNGASAAGSTGEAAADKASAVPSGGAAGSGTAAAQPPEAGGEPEGGGASAAAQSGTDGAAKPAPAASSPAPGKASASDSGASAAAKAEAGAGNGAAVDGQAVQPSGSATRGAAGSGELSAESSAAASAGSKPAASEEQAATVTVSIVGPSDVGDILKKTEVELEQGDTVLDVLKRVTRANKIHMEFRGRGATAYIEGIDNIYEFDYGSGSGWMYNINGKYPNRGAGVWSVKAGQHIEWRYTEDLGKDLGVEMGGLWDGKEE